MNTKLAIVFLLLLSVTAGACMITAGNQEVSEMPRLGVELADLKRAYKRGAIDEKQYRTRKEILLTTWELTVGDRYK